MYRHINLLLKNHIVLISSNTNQNLCWHKFNSSLSPLRCDFNVPKPVPSLVASQVWLALQMMFFPIDFVGIPSRPIVPSWFGLPINGWQGIVPRKAEVMARRACDRMIGNIVTIEDRRNGEGLKYIHVFFPQAKEI